MPLVAARVDEIERYAIEIVYPRLSELDLSPAVAIHLERGGGNHRIAARDALETGDRHGRVDGDA